MCLAFAQALRSMGPISPLWIYCCRSSSIAEVLWLHPQRRVGSKTTVCLFHAEWNNGVRPGWLEFFSVSDLVHANSTICAWQQLRAASAAGLPSAPALGCGSLKLCPGWTISAPLSEPPLESSVLNNIGKQLRIVGAVLWASSRGGGTWLWM